MSMGETARRQGDRGATAETAETAEAASTGTETAADIPKARLTIHKGVDGELSVGGLRFVACRREIERVDGGVTLIVRGRDGAGEQDRDLVRFDFFRNRPHYHVPAESQAERTIDPERHGDGLAWGLSEISTGMRPLIEEAGFAALAAEIDAQALEKAAPQLRALVEGLAEPTETSFFEVDPKVLEALGLDPD